MPSLRITPKTILLGNRTVPISRWCSEFSSCSYLLNWRFVWAGVTFLQVVVTAATVYFTENKEGRSYYNRLNLKILKNKKKKKQEWVPFLLLSSVNVFSYQRIIKKSQTVSMYCTEYRYRYKCCIWPSLFISWFLCCKPSVCGTVLKRHNMFWSCVDCRTSKEQSFMSLFFVHTETVKHSLINTHLPRAHFILVLFIATPLSLNILQINCYYILYHCVDLKLNGKNEVAKLWKWKCYVLVFAEGGTHLICFLNKAFHSWRQMDTWSYTRMVYEAYPLYCQIFY